MTHPLIHPTSVPSWRLRSPWRGGTLADRAAGWIAWWLPRKVVYFAVIRAWAHATCGQYGSTVALEITADVVLRRWERRP